MLVRVLVCGCEGGPCLIVVLSDLTMFVRVCGSHSLEQYSSVDLISVLYAIGFMSCVQPCRFLLKNPSERLAF